MQRNQARIRDEGNEGSTSKWDIPETSQEQRIWRSLLENNSVSAGFKKPSLFHMIYLLQSYNHRPGLNMQKHLEKQVQNSMEMRYPQKEESKREKSRNSCSQRVLDGQYGTLYLNPDLTVCDQLKET